MKIGIVLMTADRPGVSARKYTDIRERALQAEEAGFDSLWLYDHFLYRSSEGKTTGIWECWTILAAIAEATRKPEIGTVVTCTQFRNPAILAKMAATADEISGGRLILGLGAGWNKPEFDAFGIPFDHRVDRFEEALQIIVPLLREGKVDFHGKYYQASDCEIVPRGPRRDGPPILIGAGGPRMLRLTARYADIWNTAYLGRPESLPERRAGLEQACAEVGRDPATIEVTATVAVWYSDLQDQAPRLSDYLSGSNEEIAAYLRGYGEQGMSHVMIQTVPHNEEALERLAKTLQMYRG